MGQRRTSGRGQPTPGERLLYALGQLYRQWRVRATLTPPNEVDVASVAKMLDVWRDVEFVQDEDEEEEERQQHFHFPSEVLIVDRRQEFPWQLLSDFEWAERQEVRDFWRYFH